MSAILYFVRHGEAASAWSESTNPGLSHLGKNQALEVSKRLSKMTSPLSTFSSPLARALETAEPLDEMWGKTAEIIPQIAEIPSNHIPFEERKSWLANVMSSDWSNQPDVLKKWRSDILNIVRAQRRDAIFFTHFMVINTIIGAAQGSEQLVSFRPDNCSVTRISVHNDELKLIERGGEAITVVQ